LSSLNFVFINIDYFSALTEGSLGLAIVVGRVSVGDFPKGLEIQIYYLDAQPWSVELFSESIHIENNKSVDWGSKKWELFLI